MVVVAILGILASIAYPSYLEYVKRARRADAQAALTELAGAMERWFADNNRYEDLDSRGVFPKYVPLGEPEDHASYELKIDLVSGGYRLTADPDVGNSPMKDDRFGCAVLTSAGLRGWDTDPDCDGGDGLEILGWD
jgi:type IV pilus assembly protein PilE